jgi:CRP-like cAMP-binding protein
MFAGLSDGALARLDGLMTETEAAPGDTLMQEGSFGQQAFIIAEGAAEVRIGGDVVGLAGAGDLVGEMSLLDDGTRTATVVALTPMRLFVLDPRQFAALFDDPHCARWIAARLAGRLRERGSQRKFAVRHA